jgi:hypothetical protein
MCDTRSNFEIPRYARDDNEAPGLARSPHTMPRTLIARFFAFVRMRDNPFAHRHAFPMPE